jgi:hypothetical protein
LRQDIAYCYTWREDEDGSTGTVCAPTETTCNGATQDEGDWGLGETSVTAPCAPER